MLTRTNNGYVVTAVPTGQAPQGANNRPKNIARQLADIITGEYAPGAELPSMHALALRLNCTGSAVTRALGRLCELGLAERHAGPGRRARYTAAVRYTVTDPTLTPTTPAPRRSPETLARVR